MVEVVVTSQPEQYKQEIKAGSYTFVADAAASVGGGETGPDPHELLLGALGACTSMTIQMFARRRGWDLQQVTVKLMEDKVDDPNEPGRQLSRITREVHVKGELNQEQIDALKVAADKCLIHKLITGPKQVETTVNAAG